MEIYSIIFGTIIVGWVIVLLVTIIRYPLDIIRGFLDVIGPNWNYRTWLFAPIWLFFYGINKLFNLNIIEPNESINNKSEEAYKSTNNLKFDFSNGDKLISYSKAGVHDLLVDFLTFSESTYQVSDFKIKPDKATIECPKNISFFDYCILVQHIWTTHKTDTFGIFISENIKFYFYQDRKTLHNLVGKTVNGKRFSIYTLDNLNKRIHLRINNKLSVKKFKIPTL